MLYIGIYLTQEGRQKRPKLKQDVALALCALSWPKNFLPNMQNVNSFSKSTSALVLLCGPFRWPLYWGIFISLTCLLRKPESLNQVEAVAGARKMPAKQNVSKKKPKKKAASVGTFPFPLSKAHPPFATT